MQSTCTNMKGRLSSTRSEAIEMIERANIMQEQRYMKKEEAFIFKLYCYSSACSNQITVVDKFLEKFTLNEREIKLLSTYLGPINDEFFEALNHLHQIHSDCQLLLTTTNQKAGYRKLWIIIHIC